MPHPEQQVIQMRPKPIFDSVASNPVPLVATPTKRAVALFGSEVFQVDNISKLVEEYLSTVEHNFTSQQKARISHILNVELSTTAGKQAAYDAIDKAQQSAMKSKNRLVEILQTDNITRLNAAVAAMLNLVQSTTVKPSILDVIENVFSNNKNRSVSDVRVSLSLYMTDISNNLLPGATKVVDDLKDVMYYTKNDLDWLNMHHAACTIKLEQLNVNEQNLTAIQTLDYQHDLEMFSRKVHSLQTHMSVVEVSLLQAQTVLHTLEIMIDKIKDTVNISVPAYIQQLAFMSTMKNMLTDDQISKFEQHKNTVIADLTNFITIKR